MRKLAIAAAGAGLAIALWANWQEIAMRVPGVIGRIVDPLGENVPVVWQAEPVTPPSGERHRTSS